MEVGKVGYNTCKMVYNKLGTENARTALKMLKGYSEQGITPRISRLRKDVMELQFYNPYPNATGHKALVTQVFDFVKKVINQYSAANNPYIGGKFCPGDHLNSIKFSELGLR